MNSFSAAVFIGIATLISPQMSQAQVPVINSFSPGSGPVGTTVTILGENFSPLGSNIVYFGAVRANIVSGTTNILEATVPVGATYAPITVTVEGLVAYANAAFQPTFLGNGQPISTSTFAPRQDKAAGAIAFLTVNADLDGNGKPDLAVANIAGHTISLFRNISTNGFLGTASFARFDLPAISTSDGPYGLTGGDVDGDGKIDLVFADPANNRVGVHRNLSTIGILSSNSFSAPIYFSVGVTPRFVHVRDIDGDGKSEIVTANSGGTVSVLRNIGVSGSLNTNSFAPTVNLTAGTEAWDVAIQDLDGDGKPDLAVAHLNAAFISLFRNVSTPGGITTNSFAPRVDLPAVAQHFTVIAGDVDGDGKPDLLAGGKGGILSVYRNLANPGTLTTNSFAAQVNFGNPGWVHTIALGDINGDGKPDINIVGELNDYMAIYQNQSVPGSFTAASLATRVDYATGWNAWGNSVGDLDGDERPDIVFCNAYNDSLSFYRNITPFGGPPIITSQPTNQTVAAGANATFRVTATGSQPLIYQWRFNGTNIGSATTSSLTLSNVQPANSGNYSVLVTNSSGNITSSNALLTVGIPPAITVQPQDQNVLLGSNATFSVSATGTSLNYQWRRSGIPISNATVSSYSITNVQSTNTGGYSVIVTNAIGSVTSVVANLTVIAPPTIVAQPQNQTVGAGSNVTFTVGAGGGDPSLPAVLSGTLRLWLKADAGVTVSGSKVTQWSDQSANTNHARQLNTNLQPSFVATAIPVSGKPAIRFDGIQSPTTGDFLQATGNVNIAGNYTSFLVYNKANRVVTEEAPVVVGIPNVGSALRSHYIRSFSINNEMAFSGWGNDVGTGFSIPTNTVRIWTDRLNGSELGFFDTDGISSFTLTQGIGGLSTPGAGYYIGGLGDFTRNFQGDIAEVIFYQSALSDPDRISVQNYLKQKYYQTSTSGGGTLSYQWKFEGTNIVGATASSLTLSIVQPQNAGNYSVVVSNNYGGTISSNAVLTVVFPPSITAQPQNQSVLAGSNVNFSVTATGTSPLSYQWLFNGIAISGATGSAYSINNAQPTNGGNYSVVVTNAAGSKQSDSASLQILTPPTIVLQPESQSVLAGTNVTFSVTAEAFLPTILSGNLRLWLKADQGVIAANGRVTEWRDQSANGNHAFQSNTNKQPLLIGSAVPISSQPTVRFDGVQDVATGDWMRGTNSVGIPTGYTSFLVYSRADRTIPEQALVGIGIPAQQGALRSYFVRNAGEM
ncbi:MAG: immunoglobulin domain-containing protein, partial [Verrucomicrobiota bacterium]